MKPTVVARSMVLVLALLTTACTKDVTLSDSSTTPDSANSGETSTQADTSNDGATDESQVEELTPAELEAQEAEAAAALVIRKSFDKLVFNCGLDGDLGQCVELREVLDTEAENELIERCGLQDKVACDALNNTVVADLQVQCVYQVDADSCSALEDSWELNADSTYGLSDSMTQAPLETLEANCLLGGVLECAELATRDAN